MPFAIVHQRCDQHFGAVVDAFDLELHELIAALAKGFATEVAHRVASHCVEIHGALGLMEGYPVERYFRDGRALSDKLELLQRVAACNSQVNSGWFPEDEGNVAAWLNKHYYRFEK